MTLIVAFKLLKCVGFYLFICVLKEIGKRRKLTIVVFITYICQNDFG